MSKLYLLILTFLLVIPLSLSAEEVRIGILTKYNLTEFKIHVEEGRIFYLGKDKALTNGIWKVELARGKLQFTKDKTALSGEHFLLNSTKAFTISASTPKQKITRTYQGSLELYPKNGRIVLVLTLPLEKYVSSSTHSELGELLFANKFTNESERNELIASQEIVIRTYIRNEKKRHSEENYDFCDLTHCIHFAGNQNKSSLHPGIILHGKASVNGYFHSTCGGHLSGPEVFWPRHEISPHYRRGNESNCKESPHFEWEALLSISELEKILSEKGIISIQPVRKDERVRALKFTNINQETRVIPIYTFFSNTGKLHGWNKIKSNDFNLEKIGSRYKVKGRGLGHGIGLCQWGAAGLAAKGKSYKEILEFYFPGTMLIRR